VPSAVAGKPGAGMSGDDHRAAKERATPAVLWRLGRLGGQVMQPKAPVAMTRLRSRSARVRGWADGGGEESGDG